MLFGKSIIGLDYEIKMIAEDGIEPSDKTSAEWTAWHGSRDKLKHFTLIFNLLVFLQFFNMINCRKVGRRDFNVFEKFFHNFYFLGIFFGEILVQVCLNYYIPALTKQVVLSKQDWGSIVVVAFTVILVAFLLKLTPESWIAKIPTSKMVDEDRAVNNKVLNMWQGGDQKEMMSDDFREAPAENDEQDFPTVA